VSNALKTATSVVGLLAGLVAGVYVLGGLVIALRLLFDHFDFNSVVTTLGQLPREPVVATALMDVLAPAATLGLLAAMGYGLFNRPKSRGDRSDHLDKGRHWWVLVCVVFPLLAALFCLPAILQAIATDGFSWLLLTSVIGIAVTYGALATSWFLIRRAGRSGWSRIVRALAAGALWAVILITPAVMIASALPFERAQVCTTSSLLPVKGRLIGEGGGRILIEEQFGNEAGVVSVPADQVTKSEYGDLVTNFVCPLPPGSKAAAKVAEAKLGGHGSQLERRLATLLRPRLRFDTKEPWRPLAVAPFLQEHFADGGGQEACWLRPERRCEPNRGLDQFRRGPGAPEYIDIHGSGRNGRDFRSPDPACRADPPAVDCNSGRRSVIYYRRTTHEGRWYWDYWWFYRYNDYVGRFNECHYYCADHEGDWEGMTVITTPALKPEILGAIYAAHRERVLVEAQILPLSGTHPLAFVAEGTHATYPYRCASDCSQYATEAGVHLPEDDRDGEVAWGGNVDAECAEVRCVRPLPEVGHPGDAALPLAGGWAGWSGRWGSTCVNGCSLAESSPASPGVQIRFQCPWAPTRLGVLAADGSVSKSERAGDAERLRATCEAQRGA
jgi:hypothetical protein